MRRWWRILVMSLAMLFAVQGTASLAEAATRSRAKKTQRARAARPRAVSPAKAAAARHERKLVAYMNGAATILDPKVHAVLAKIGNMPRRLLAVRYYLRRRHELEKWTWSAKEIAQFKKSAEYRRAMEEVQCVKQTFAELYPGYSLQVNPEIRSLGTQIGKWNSVRSVAVSARELLDTIRVVFADSVAYPDVPTDSSITRFRAFISELELLNIPTVAVPGYSQHGQLRAFDFKISKGGRLIAGTSTSSIESVWDAHGWSQKLKQAVEYGSDRFTGPLDAPREPWHYTYTH